MDRDIIQAVLTWLRSISALAALGVDLERLPTDRSGGAMLQSLQGDPVVTRYRSGGYIAQYPFAVVVRTGAGDTSGRLDAMDVLGALWAAVEAGSRPDAPDGSDIVSLAIRTTPARISADEDGTEDYQATFALTYRKRG